MKKILLPILILLPICLTPVSFKASALESGVTGAKTRADIVIGPNWVVLSSATVNIPAGQFWHCMATGSADPHFDKETKNNRYVFTLTIDEISPPDDGRCERTIEFNDNASVTGGISDNRFNAVSSTCPFFRVAGGGTHTVYWLGKKIEKASNLTILDNSLTVVCSDNRLK